MSKQRKTKTLKRVDLPHYIGRNNIVLDIYIQVANYGKCPLKIGDGYQEFDGTLHDLYLNDMGDPGPESIRRFRKDKRTLVIAITTEGLKGILYDFDLDNIRLETTEVLWHSLQNNGTLILDILEVKLYSRLEYRSNSELDKVWVGKNV